MSIGRVGICNDRLTPDRSEALTPSCSCSSGKTPSQYRACEHHARSHPYERGRLARVHRLDASVVGPGRGSIYRRRPLDGAARRLAGAAHRWIAVPAQAAAVLLAGSRCDPCVRRALAGRSMGVDRSRRFDMRLRLLARTQLCGRASGVWSVAVLAVCPLFFGGSQFANMDMLVAAFIALTLTLAVLAARSATPAPTYWWRLCRCGLRVALQGAHRHRPTCRNLCVVGRVVGAQGLDRESCFSPGIDRAGSRRRSVVPDGRGRDTRVPSLLHRLPSLSAFRRIRLQ